MRKLASQLPSAVSRLLQSTVIDRPPTWYIPVLTNPPPVLPPRQTPARARAPAASSSKASSSSTFSDVRPERLNKSREGRTSTHEMKHMREPKPKPEDIVYPEDRIRRQFFRDFPFEALRPTSLVEDAEIQVEKGVTGPEWTKLSQRGAYPTVEKSVSKPNAELALTLAFVLSLTEHHRLPLTQAYAIATNEFVQLRAAHEMATIAAEQEARAHGAVFQPTPAERQYNLEGRALDTLGANRTGDAKFGTSTRYKKPTRWTSVIPSGATPSSAFTGTQAYTAKWRLPAPEAASMPQSVTPPSAAAAGTASPQGTEVGSAQDGEEVDTMVLLQQQLGVKAPSAP